MNDLEFVKNTLSCLDPVFKEFKKAYNLKSNRYIRNWHACANKMESLLEKELGFSCYVTIRKDKDHALYDMTFDGAANVPEEHFSESELEITVNLSPEMYTQQLFVPESTWKKYKQHFTLTFIHELTHSLQFDNGDTQNDYEDYFSSPFEIDAYSSELAFDMFLYAKPKTQCEAFMRYSKIKDRKIFEKFTNLTEKKYGYLKNNK
tara:strand:+ start:482 stop:1096 length:615 start_codon:yes stop_codon:yes gene_type:complete